MRGYAAELTRFGIETTIVVPGSFTSGTNHFAIAGRAADDTVAADYETEYAGLMDEVSQKLAELAPDGADPAEVARQIVKVVDTPKGSHSGSTSTPPMTVQRTSSASVTASASGSFSGSVWTICSA